MDLTPSQSVIALDPSRFRVLNCGRRFGKTTLAIDQIKARACIPNSRIAYIAQTYQQARDIAWEQLKNDCKNSAQSINESRLEIKLVNGSVIILRGWESIETLRGQKFDLVVLDEVAGMKNFWINWNEVIRPTLTDTKGEALFISTPKGFNHFYDLFNLQDKDKDYKSFHFTSYDNPHLPVDELNKARSELPEDQFAQEYLADFRKTQGLVYKDFDRAKHVYTESTINPVMRLVGIDWGYTNPSAIYLVIKDTDANYWITQEYYKTGKTTQEIIEYASSLRGNKYYPDPAEPDRLEEMRRAGLNVMDVSKDIEAGISTVQELLKTKRLHVHSSCVNLINEFETYRYPDKKPDMNEKETPIKEHDHALDAIRYGLYMQEAHQSTGQAKQFIPKGMSARRGYQLPIR
jgi:PBSX family phage terminase large subunit